MTKEKYVLTQFLEFLKLYVLLIAVKKYDGDESNLIYGWIIHLDKIRKVIYREDENKCHFIFFTNALDINPVTTAYL